MQKTIDESEEIEAMKFDRLVRSVIDEEFTAASAAFKLITKHADVLIGKPDLLAKSFRHATEQFNRATEHMVAHREASKSRKEAEAARLKAAEQKAFQEGYQLGKKDTKSFYTQDD